MQETEALDEAERLMTICNSCRYCEGLCAVFPAMELRKSFEAGDLNYLANLCHNCGACYDACQFSPPHEFQVSVPQTLAQVRGQSYATYAWPRALAPMFERNGLIIAVLAALSVAGFVSGFKVWADPGTYFSVQSGPGAFYRIMPHTVMTVIFGVAFLYAVLAMGMEVRAFLADIGDPAEPRPPLRSVWTAIKDAGRLRYLDGGDSGCDTRLLQTRDLRKYFHHATSYGFLLCFASTSTATLYHYGLGIEAPYPWYALPVLLGIVGGIGLIAGTLGLMWEKYRRDPAVQDRSTRGMDMAFLVMLLLTALGGLLLLVMRQSPLLGLLLSAHLGVVFALFITMPYGKFMHGIYRFAALVRYAKEIDALRQK